MRAQPVSGLISVDVQARDVDHHVQRVQVAGGFGTEEFVSRDVQPGKAFYLMAQLCRETESGAELLLPMLDHLPRNPSSAA